MHCVHGRRWVQAVLSCPPEPCAQLPLFVPLPRPSLASSSGLHSHDLGRVPCLGGACCLYVPVGSAARTPAAEGGAHWKFSPLPDVRFCSLTWEVPSLTFQTKHCLFTDNFDAVWKLVPSSLSHSISQFSCFSSHSLWPRQINLLISSKYSF